MHLLAMRGDFYADDFLNYSIAHENRADLHYLAIPNFDHFQPGFRAMFLFFQRVLPFHYDAVHVVIILIDVAAMLAFWRLLTLVIGARKLSLVLLTVFGVSNVMLTNTTWMTAAVNTVAMLFPLILAVDGHIRWMLHRRVRDLLLGAVALVVAVSFLEKPLLYVIYLPVLLVLLFAGRLRPGAVVSVVLRAWPLWALDAVLLAPYLYHTLHHPQPFAPPPNGIRPYLDGTARSWFFGVVPNTFGGPVQSKDIVDSMGLLPASLDAAVHQLIAGIIIGATLLLRRHSLRWWAFLGFAVISNAVLVLRFRESIFGPDIATDPRYLIDTAMLMLLVIGLAAVGPCIGPGAADPGWRWDSVRLRIARLFATPQRRSAAAVAVGVVACAAFLVPALHQEDRWHAEGAVAWLGNMRSSLATTGSDVAIWDVDVPGAVFTSPAPPWRYVSRVVSLIDHSAVFDRARDVTWIPDANGRLVRASFVVDAHGRAPQPECVSGSGSPVSMQVRFDRTVPPGVTFLVFPFHASSGTVVHLFAYNSAGEKQEGAGRLILLDGTGTAAIRLMPVEIASMQIEMISKGSLCTGTMNLGHPTG